MKLKTIILGVIKSRFSPLLLLITLGCAYLRVTTFLQSTNTLLTSDVYIRSSRSIFEYALDKNYRVKETSEWHEVYTVTEHSAYERIQKKRLLIATLVSSHKINTSLIERNFKHIVPWGDLIVVLFGSNVSTKHIHFSDGNATEKVIVSKYAQPIEDIVKERVENRQFTEIKWASVDYDIHPKPLLYLELLDYVEQYESIMVIDDDILLDTLNIPKLLEKLACVKPLVSQTAVKSKPNRYVPYLNYDARFTEKNYISSTFVEMQCPIFNSKYFKYFTENYIKPMIGPIALLGSDNGMDNIWCQIARHYSARYKGHTNDFCVVFADQHVLHLNLQTSRLMGDSHPQQRLRNKELAHLFFRKFQTNFTFGSIAKPELKRFPAKCEKN
jgi:hypothetical protein